MVVMYYFMMYCAYRGTTLVLQGLDGWLYLEKHTQIFYFILYHESGTKCYGLMMIMKENLKDLDLKDLLHHFLSHSIYSRIVLSGL